MACDGMRNVNLIIELTIRYENPSKMLNMT